jgi:deferrochelatase/peroxidase EfeB
MMDFLDGISNINPKERRKAIFTGIGSEPHHRGEEIRWLRGSTYMCFMRILVDINLWRSMPPKIQKIIVGRDKITGCPLNTGKSVEPIKECPSSGTQDILNSHNINFREYNYTDPQLRSSHVGRVRLSDNTEVRIFRQGYNFFDATNVYPYFSTGLNFVSFQRDPKYIQIILTDKKWMGGVSFGGQKEIQRVYRLNKFMTVESAGMFFVPQFDKGEYFPGHSIF